VLSRAEEDAVPLVDLSMVEQRYDAVREVLDGASVKDTAARYGIDRRSGLSFRISIVRFRSRSVIPGRTESRATSIP
jgi:hypothetical protein